MTCLRRWWSAPAVAALLVAACQPAVARPSGSTSSPGAASAGALARADGEMWKGRYAEAEAAYRRLEPSDPHAGAHLAVLLTYENRFHEAVAAAAEAVQAKADSDTLARLTRALDWSGDVPAALAAGRIAIASKPVDPVAHDYYAEALADAGLYDLAQAQLRLAEARARTAYERAEAAREWSNYYRDRGEAAPELSYAEIAFHYEPGFPERSVELAREYFGATPARTADARALLDSLATPFAREPAVLAAAGDTAFMAGERAESERCYRAALAGSPGDPGASLGLAEDQMAFDHDAKAARTTLLAATPTDAVTGYLLELDRLVLARDPAQDGAGAGPSPDLAAERHAALEAVAGYRRQVGLPQLSPNPVLDQAAEAHAYYVLFNWGSKSLEGLGVHQEQPGAPGFTGQNSAIRDQHFGYTGYQSSEVINHVYTAAAAVEVWGDSVYHRFPLIGRESADEGFGSAQVGSLAVQVMDVGVGPPGSSAPLAYPAEGQTGVPAAFAGNEIPDPAPAAAYPTGYPITLLAGGADVLAINSATVTAPGGGSLALIVDRPGRLDLGPNEAAILPRAPLQPGATYRVRVFGQLDGRPWSLSWSFTVAA